MEETKKHRKRRPAPGVSKYRGRNGLGNLRAEVRAVSAGGVDPDECGQISFCIFEILNTGLVDIKKIYLATKVLLDFMENYVGLHLASRADREGVRRLTVEFVRGIESGEYGREEDECRDGRNCGNPEPGDPDAMYG